MVNLRFQVWQTLENSTRDERIDIYRRAVRPKENAFMEISRKHVISFAMNHDKELFEKIKREELGTHNGEPVTPTDPEPVQEKNDFIGDYAKKFLIYEGGSPEIEKLKREKAFTPKLKQYLHAHVKKDDIQGYHGGVRGLVDAVRKRIDLIMNKK